MDRTWDLHLADAQDLQIILMFGMLTPVPGTLSDPLTPLGFAFNVIWNGPSLIDFDTDLIPCSVMFTPWMVRSKLMRDRLVT